MSTKKVIGVIGATGAQGGGLVRAILGDADGPFRVRAFTRNTTGDKAKALAEAGAEVVALDMDKPDAEALKGVYGLFVVTNFWEHFSAEKEIAQVKAIVAAGEAAGVEHYVWSTLDNSAAFFDSVNEDKPKRIHGMYVPHFDGKYAANAAFPESKTTMLYTSFYLENFYNFGMISKGACVIPLKDSPMSVIAAEDIGYVAYGIFKNAGTKGQSVYASGENAKVADMMKIFSEVTGAPFNYSPVDRDTYAGFGFPGADDLANMFDLYARDANFCKLRDVAKVRALHPGLKDIRTWAQEHKGDLLSKCT